MYFLCGRTFRREVWKIVYRLLRVRELGGGEASNDIQAHHVGLEQSHHTLVRTG